MTSDVPPTTSSPAPTSSRPKALVKLTVYLDIICPWCYVGFARITRAIQLAKDNDLPLAFELKFEPYTLEPDLPLLNGPRKMERMIDMHGEAGALKEVRRLYKTGTELGITFSYYGVTSQSMLAHRLLMKAHLVGGQQVQQPLLHEIFKGYFEDDHDLGDVPWLASCAARMGLMSSIDATTFLLSSELETDVQMQNETAHRAGISGVPFSIICRKWALSGAQPEHVYYAIFEKIAARLKVQLERAGGEDTGES